MSFFLLYKCQDKFIKYNKLIILFMELRVFLPLMPLNKCSFKVTFLINDEIFPRNQNLYLYKANRLFYL